MYLVYLAAATEHTDEHTVMWKAPGHLQFEGILKDEVVEQHGQSYGHHQGQVQVGESDQVQDGQLACGTVAKSLTYKEEFNLIYMYPFLKNTKEGGKKRQKYHTFHILGWGNPIMRQTKVERSDKQRTNPMSNRAFFFILT